LINNFSEISIIQIDNSSSYEIILNEGISFNISDSFHSDIDIGLHYVPVEKDLNEFGNIQWAKRPKRLPVVFSKNEMRQILDEMSGIY